MCVCTYTRTCLPRRDDTQETWVTPVPLCHNGHVTMVRRRSRGPKIRREDVALFWFLLTFPRFAPLFRPKSASGCHHACLWKVPRRGMQGLSAPLRREQRRGRARHRACVTFACTLLLKYGLQMGRFLHGGWAHKPGTHAVSGRAGGQICPAEINHPITICHPHPPTHTQIPNRLASITSATPTLLHHHSLTRWSVPIYFFPKRCMDVRVMEAVCIGDLGSRGWEQQNLAHETLFQQYLL